MCTVLAKESQTRVIVLTGVRCCLTVEHVEPYIPKVSRENGWFEVYVGDIGQDLPAWTGWLSAQARHEVVSKIPDTYHGKRVYYFDVHDRLPAELQA